jgi:hypothetical protein
MPLTITLYASQDITEAHLGSGDPNVVVFPAGTPATLISIEKYGYFVRFTGAKLPYFVHEHFLTTEKPANGANKEYVVDEYYVLADANGLFMMDPDAHREILKFGDLAAAQEWVKDGEEAFTHPICVRVFERCEYQEVVNVH